MNNEYRDNAYGREPGRQYGPNVPPTPGQRPQPGYRQGGGPGYPGHDFYQFEQGGANGYGASGRMPARPAGQESNGIGTAGFVLSLVTVFSSWVPFAGVMTWILAIVFSAIGLGRKPRGLAVAGLIISLGLPVLFVLFVIALAALGTLSNLDELFLLRNFWL